MSSVTELEQDVAETRRRLHATIDRIQDKLTVSGMVDEVMGQAGVPRLTNGHDFVLGLLRRHPVPVMIAAAGLGFLIYRMSKGETGSRLLVRRDPSDPPVMPGPDSLEGSEPLTPPRAYATEAAG